MAEQTKQKLIKITLLKPHTHAGRDYPEDAVISVQADTAEWLISLKAAKKHEEKK